MLVTWRYGGTREPFLDEEVPFMAPQYIAPDVVAAEIDMSTAAVLRWIRNGDLPAIKLGNRVRIHRADLDAFLQKRRMNSAKGGGPR